MIRTSLGYRAKESLTVDFINQTDLDKIRDKAGVIAAFFIFAQAEQQREAQELIGSENLKQRLRRLFNHSPHILRTIPCLCGELSI